MEGEEDQDRPGAERVCPITQTIHSSGSRGKTIRWEAASRRRWRTAARPSRNGRTRAARWPQAIRQQRGGKPRQATLEHAERQRHHDVRACLGRAIGGHHPHPVPGDRDLGHGPAQPDIAEIVPAAIRMSREILGRVVTEVDGAAAEPVLPGQGQAQAEPGPGGTGAAAHDGRDDEQLVFVHQPGRDGLSGEPRPPTVRSRPAASFILRTWPGSKSRSMRVLAVSGVWSVVE